MTPSLFAVDGLMLKAVPHTEGERRLIYCEPSNENRDLEGERMSKAALERQAPIFLRHRNFDIAHRSLMCPEDGIENPDHWEIGVPLDVRFEPLRVVGEIYRATGTSVSPRLRAAEEFWQSITEQDPPKPWYPSVGGLKLHKICDENGCDVDQALWVNIGFWRVPMNTTVRQVSRMSAEAFGKSVVAGYGTDVSSLEGGAAVRKESLHGAHEHDRYKYNRAVLGLFKAIEAGACEHARPPLSPEKILAHFRDCEKTSGAAAARYTVTMIDQMARRVRARQESAAQAA